MFHIEVTEDLADAYMTNVCNSRVVGSDDVRYSTATGQLKRFLSITTKKIF